MRRGDGQALGAGAVASLVGFASTFALVLAGLRAVGASEAQAASGLLTLCLTMGVVAIALAWRLRMPVAVAWSTPGAALLLAGGEPAGGYAAALGAFVVTGVLIVLAGLFRPLERWIARIPAPLAAAMLAGVILPVCLAPVRAAVELPGLALPAIATWLVLGRFARAWAVPAALAVTVVVIVADRSPDVSGGVLPSLALTAPEFHLGTLVGLAVPLFIVTMASQNVTGMGVLAGFGYRPPARPVLVATGAATAAGAPFGAHAINLAAITAALVAAPEAHPDAQRRWLAAAAGGATYVALGLGAAVVTAVVAAAPSLLVEAVAGLALLGALAGALAGALEDPRHRDAAVVTFVVSASSISVAGIGAPFWGLVAGLGLQAIRSPAWTRPPASAPTPSRDPSSSTSAPSTSATATAS